MTKNKTINQLITEYSRPWKLFTLTIGLLLLILGSFYYKTPERDVNFLVSLSLYGMCGLVWYYEGSMKDVLSNFRKEAKKSRG